MTEITGILLCGGSGRRFQGQDKPLLKFRGRTLAEHALRRLVPQVAEVIISANRNAEVYQRYGHKTVNDDEPDQGPLAGVAAAARQARYPLLFVCPGDSPFVPLDLVARLSSVLTPEVDAVVPSDGQRSQHLFMLLRARTCPDLEEYLAGGGRSVHKWLRDLNTLSVEILEPQAFLNINDPQQLEDMEQSGNR